MDLKSLRYLTCIAEVWIMKRNILAVWNLANNQKSDIIVFTGDMVNNRANELIGGKT